MAEFWTFIQLFKAVGRKLSIYTGIVPLSLIWLFSLVELTSRSVITRLKG